MRVTISSSSNDAIETKYKESSKKVCEYLASRGWDLNWWSCSISIMGICYDEFGKQNRKMYGFTSPKYQDDIDNLPNAIHDVFETTFDLKKKEMSEIINPITFTYTEAIECGGIIPNNVTSLVYYCFKEFN